MGGQVIYIGGASAAGKSTAAQTLGEALGLPLVELDRYFDLIAGAGCDEDTAAAAASALARRLVEDLLAAGGRCIVEGGWLDPAAALALSCAHTGRFTAVYCGYPSGDLEDRLACINAKGEHWLAGHSAAEARAFLEQQVEASRWYRSECRRCGLAFVDFSDPGAGLRRLVERWAPGRDPGPSAAGPEEAQTPGEGSGNLSRLGA
jgi:predicted kinase